MKPSSPCVPAWLVFLLLALVFQSDGKLKIAPRAVGAHAVSFTFNCATNAYYQILTADSLTRGDWSMTTMGLGSLSPAAWTSDVSRSMLYLSVCVMPQSASRDEDGDGLDDVFELQHAGFDPLNPSDAWRDSDQDSMPDGWEMTHGLNPTVQDAHDDPDQDGLLNGYEYLHGTHPWKRWIVCSNNPSFLLVVTPGQ